MLIGAIEVSEWNAYNRFRAGETVTNRIADAKAAKESFDTFYQEVKPIIKDADVWDIGGAAGVDYIRTGKISKHWTVFELPETQDAYTKAMENENLIDDFNYHDLESDLFCWRGGAEPVVLWLAGSLQYHDRPLKFLITNSQYAGHVILKDLPISNKTFLTCQHRVGMAWCFRFEDIEAALPGFELISGQGPHRPYSHGETLLPAGYEVYDPVNLIFKRR